ncbi:hypothetical protein QFC21_006950 [Naganishia friedmannii]|uniref:Uncharacterized protein n=1 Tax=Naganishia friedmannii TaxID=89922 RepID=A0ACC2UZN1_9TREE|nr:hypothetical protein QFC21_006950 [Naganishia friedmannii]
MSQAPVSKPSDITDVPQEPSNAIDSPVSDEDTSGNLCHSFLAINEEYGDSAEFGNAPVDSSSVSLIVSLLDVLSDPYSPSDPAYVYCGDLSDFRTSISYVIEPFSSYAVLTEPYASTIPRAPTPLPKARSPVTALPYLFSGPFLTPLPSPKPSPQRHPLLPLLPSLSTSTPKTGFQTQQYKGWYEAELARGPVPP